MSYYLTVDGGTTNTRVYLARENDDVLDCFKINIGAQKGIGGNDTLKGAISGAISFMLRRYELSEDYIECIIASGMITSEFGLVNLPHIMAPAGISELKAAAVKKYLPEITSIPFVFIPGVKTVSEELSGTDMMRGEETELFGLTPHTMPDALYVLPGSHSKLIKTDDRGRIVSFKTMLTGEMIAALSQGTILKDAVDLTIDSFDRVSLEEGCAYAEEHGINEALFKTRVQKNLFNKSPVKVYSFFLGAVLSGEINEILKIGAETIVIGGKPQLRKAMAQLVLNRSKARIIDAGCRAENATAMGAVRIIKG